jgi:CRP/FNR family transcriptional regulator, nitrogen fixation regulation protein
MQSPEAHVVSAPRSLAGPGPKMVELAPGVSLPCSTMQFGRNEEIFAEEEEADFVYKVISGTVRDVRILSDGRRQVGAFHLAGEVFGLDCGTRHRYSAEAVVDCEIALVRRSALDKAVDADGVAARKLWGVTSRDLQQLQDHMLLLGRKSAIERVASFLRGMFSRSPMGDAVDLAMSRTDIADYLGLTIETISRTLTQLERSHAISMPTSRHIVLHGRLAMVEG